MAAKHSFSNAAIACENAYYICVAPGTFKLVKGCWPEAFAGKGCRGSCAALEFSSCCLTAAAAARSLQCSSSATSVYTSTAISRAEVTNRQVRGVASRRATRGRGLGGPESARPIGKRGLPVLAERGMSLRSQSEHPPEPGALLP